jgi:hypothetical protein
LGVDPVQQILGMRPDPRQQVAGHRGAADPESTSRYAART